MMFDAAEEQSMQMVEKSETTKLNKKVDTSRQLSQREVVIGIEIGNQGQSMHSIFYGNR